jgi:type VI secretion system protein ImpA
MAVIEALRRVPLVGNRQHGTFSLHDIEARQQGAGAGTEAAADDGQVSAAFASMSAADLTRLKDAVVGSVATLRKIDATMREGAGSEASVNFDALATLLTRMGHVLVTRLAARPESREPEAPGDEGQTGPGVAADMMVGGVVVGGGVVRSRQDAVRALEAIAEFFRRTEPSSPIPLLLDRAKRLVSKNFLEVLADIAPDAVTQARAVSGLREGE